MNSPHTPPTQAELDAWKAGELTLKDGLRLIIEVERLRKDKERLAAIGLLWSATFQKYESWKANGVMNDTLKQVLIDYRKCSAMQQKGEE